MKTGKWFATLSIACAGLAGMDASADDEWMSMKDVHATVGVRFWQTDWSTWGNVSKRNYSSADLRWSVIPVVSVSHRDWFASASYQAPGTFEFKETGFGFRLHRKEYDVNVGYFFVPGRLAATLGWKSVEYDAPNSNYKWTAKGPTIGLAGNAPIADWAVLYGNMGIGRPKLDDVTHFVGKRGKYFLTEFGLAFPLGAHSNALSGAVVTAGYRYQRIAAYPSFSTLEHVELYEIAQGPVVGLAWRF